MISGSQIIVESLIWFLRVAGSEISLHPKAQGYWSSMFPTKQSLKGHGPGKEKLSNVLFYTKLYCNSMNYVSHSHELWLTFSLITRVHCDFRVASTTILREGNVEVS